MIVVYDNVPSTEVGTSYIEPPLCILSRTSSYCAVLESRNICSLPYCIAEYDV